MNEFLKKTRVISEWDIKKLKWGEIPIVRGDKDNLVVALLFRMWSVWDKVCIG